MTTLAFRRLHDDARLPIRSHAQDVGLDLSSVEAWTIPPGGACRIDTGLAVALPPDHAGLIWPRSGLAVRGVEIRGGCIDPGYGGPVGVILHNGGIEDLRIKVGDRIAQLLVIEVTYLTPTWVAELPASDRGSAGFGSTSGRTTGGEVA